MLDNLFLSIQFITALFWSYEVVVVVVVFEINLHFLRILQ